MKIEMERLQKLMKEQADEAKKQMEDKEVFIEGLNEKFLQVRQSKQEEIELFKQ